MSKQRNGKASHDDHLTSEERFLSAHCKGQARPGEEIEFCFTETQVDHLLELLRRSDKGKKARKKYGEDWLDNLIQEDR